MKTGGVSYQSTAKIMTIIRDEIHGSPDYDTILPLIFYNASKAHAQHICIYIYIPGIFVWRPWPEKYGGRHCGSLQCSLLLVRFCRMSSTTWTSTRFWLPLFFCAENTLRPATASGACKNKRNSVFSTTAESRVIHQSCCVPLTGPMQ